MERERRFSPDLGFEGFKEEEIEAEFLQFLSIGDAADFDGGSLVSPSTKEPITGSVEGHGGLNSRMEVDEGEDFYQEKEERDYGYLCTIFCDFLCGLASAPDRVRFDPIMISRKAMFGFRKCYKNGEWTSCQPGTDTIGIDIRGLYIPIALQVLMMHLYCWSGHAYLKRILVTVGCMEHGCGEGKLKRAVIGTLKRDPTIQFELLDTDGATISILLDREDYTSIGWPLVDRVPAEGNMKVPDHGVASEQTSKGEEVEEEDMDEEYGELCTNVCDFLADLDTTKPGLLWDREISAKVLSGFRKCEKDEPCELGDDAVGIDIRGHYVTDALKIMMTHLFCWSRESDVKKLFVKVGCKKHGCGEGKLKEKVIEVLKLDEKIRFDDLDNESTICIHLDGLSDYKDTNWYLADIEEETRQLVEEIGKGI